MRKKLHAFQSKRTEQMFEVVFLLLFLCVIAQEETENIK
tara:strand:- start:277 stop:393 length:117 start_codon:yes stop_codon:yes gene_type:complete